MIEKVEFTNMCMIQNGNKVLVINRKAKDWPEDGVRYVVLFYKTIHFEGALQSSDEGEVFW